MWPSSLPIFVGVASSSTIDQHVRAYSRLSLRAAVRAAALGGKGDYEYKVIGEWEVERPAGDTHEERKRSMEYMEDDFIQGYELGDGESKAPFGVEYYNLKDETVLEKATEAAKRAIAKRDAAASPTSPAASGADPPRSRPHG